MEKNVYVYFLFLFYCLTGGELDFNIMYRVLTLKIKKKRVCKKKKKK